MNKALSEGARNFALGIHEIDEEHQVLFDCLDAIVYSQNTSFRDSQVFESLERLTDYSRTHFRVEECLMRMFDYPGLEAHRNEHSYFIDSLGLLRTKLLSEDTSPALATFLTEWLLKHIKEVDSKYVDFFRLQQGPTIASIA